MFVPACAFATQTGAHTQTGAVMCLRHMGCSFVTKEKTATRLSQMAARPPFYPPAIAERYPRTHLAESVTMLYMSSDVTVMIDDAPHSTNE